MERGCSRQKNINEWKNSWVETNHSLTYHYLRYMTRPFSSRYKKKRS